MSRRHGSLEASSPYESGIWGTPDNPCPSERTLAARLDGELDAVRAKAVDDHLDDCIACSSDAERLENLSGCLQSWNRSHGAVEPLPRLLTRVLREVSLESGALRQETRAARRRFAFAAAAAGLVIVASGVLGAISVTSAPDAADRAAKTPPFHVRVAAANSPLATVFVGEPALPRIADALAKSIPQSSRESRAPGASEVGPAIDLSSLSSRDTVEAFAAWVPAVDAQRRMGEDVCVLDGRALAVWVRQDYEHVRLWGRWIAERARIVEEPLTRDPSSTGVALSDVLPLPGSASGIGAPTTRNAILVPASSQSGGLVLWALPRDAARPADAAASPAPGAAAPIDLATAVRSGRARLLPDYSIDRGDVGVEVVASEPAAAPILVPTGELLAGGAGDRVIAQGVWMPASKSAYVIRLATRPVSRIAGRIGVVPTVVDRIAGPELRAILARGEDAKAVLDMVHAQLRGAGILPPEGQEEPSLLALYADDARGAIRWNGVAGAEGPSSANVLDDTFVHARRLVADLGDGATGFVAADPNGRFQGLERVDVAGDSGRAVLTRLIAGYLAEARVRSSADGARTGAQANDVLGELSRRPPRLSPASGPASRVSPGLGDVRPVPALAGLEPGTGLLLSAVRSSEKRVPLVSGLVRDFIR